MIPLKLQKCVYCGQHTDNPPYCCLACTTLHSVTGSIAEVPPENSEYAYLDQSNFKSLYQHDPKSQEFRFYADGMHCSSCVHLLEKLPQYCASILSARVDFSKSSVAIVLKEGGSLAAVASTIKALGYQPIPLAPDDDSADQQRKDDRQALKRIAVTGFCAGNTMLFVIPVYAGLAGDLASIFNWLSFALFLPILFYSAQPFYRGAIASLRYRTISVDFPIAVALTSGFLFSLFNLIRGDGAIYFDSTASFMFLILCARYLLKSVQRNHLASPTIKTSLSREKYICLEKDDSRRAIPFVGILPNMVLAVAPGQVLPADGRLLSKSALLDLSLFNGESLPKHYSQGMSLLGGTTNLQSEILIEVENTFSDSKIGALCRNLDNSVTAKNKFTTLTDKLAQRLILIVFLAAILFFAVYANTNVSEAFNRALALIVLACPCALAFGAPLTYGFALRKAMKSGIFIKDPNTLEKVLKLKNIFFDKTGTLTEGQLKLAHIEPRDLSQYYKNVALSLEAQSYHPIAFAVRAAWSGEATSMASTETKEILGYGVVGTIGGCEFELRALAENSHDAEVAVELLENGTRVACLYFADTLRNESREIVRHLEQNGMNCFIVSGDSKSRCLSIGAECGIQPENIFPELFPEDKKDILAPHQHICMLGDGANDSLALQSADVGIAVKGSVDLSLAHSDVYFTRGGLRPLLELQNIALKTKRILYRNLTISLLYNLVGGTLALAGFIDPTMAAVLMPISSAAVIFSSLWGFR